MGGFLFAGREINFAEYRSCVVRISYSRKDMDPKKKYVRFFFLWEKKKKFKKSVQWYGFHAVVRIRKFYFLKKKSKKKFGKIPYSRTDKQSGGADFWKFCFCWFLSGKWNFQIWVKTENFAVFRFFFFSHENILLVARNVALAWCKKRASGLPQLDTRGEESSHDGKKKKVLT